MPRDSQRARVYASERGAFIHTGAIPAEEIKALVEEVMACKVTQRRWGLTRTWPIEVKFGGSRWARAGFNTIRFPFGTMRRLVLHEVAHCINSQSAECAKEPKPEPHGWRFCAIYIDLVHRFMSPLDADALRAHFKFNRVKFTAPRTKREPTEAQRAALAKGRERLAASKGE